MMLRRMALSFVVTPNDKRKIQFCDSDLALSVRHRRVSKFEDLPCRGAFEPLLKRAGACSNE